MASMGFGGSAQRRAAGAPSPGEFTTRDGLFVVDTGQRIRLWSESADELLGVPTRVVGRRCFDVLGGTDSLNARHCRENCPVMSNAQRGRGTRNFDIHVARGNGESRTINISILLHRQDSETEVLHLFRDVTRERRVEDLASSLPAGGDAAETMTCALTPPTERQMEVLRLLATGAQPARIAEVLRVRPVTVRNHIQGAMERLGAHTRLEAVTAAAQAGLL